MHMLVGLVLLALPVPLHAATASARVVATIAAPASLRTLAGARTEVRADSVHQRRVDGRTLRARLPAGAAATAAGPQTRSLILDFE